MAQLCAYTLGNDDSLIMIEMKKMLSGHYYLTSLLEQLGYQVAVKHQNTNWNVFIPDALNFQENIYRFLRKIPAQPPCWIFIIPGSSGFTAKDLLWKWTSKVLGRRSASEYLNESWLLDNQDEWLNFERQASNTDRYVLKSNLQRQLGVTITCGLEGVRSAIEKKDFCLVQKYLNNPFLVAERKIDIRLYLLVKLDPDGVPSLYLFDDGFVYYTSEAYDTNRDEPRYHIVSGYIDRAVYEDNPLTVQQIMQCYPELNQSLNRAQAILSAIFPAFFELIQSIPQIEGATHAQLYGADFAISNDGTMKLYEINKGPDLDFKDHRDAAVKRSFIDAVVAKVGLVDAENHSRLIKVV